METQFSRVLAGLVVVAGISTLGHFFRRSVHTHRTLRYFIADTHLFGNEPYVAKYDALVAAHFPGDCRVDAQTAARAALGEIVVRSISCIGSDRRITRTVHALVPVNLDFEAPIVVETHGRETFANGYRGDNHVIFDPRAYLVSDVASRTIWHENRVHPGDSSELHCKSCDMVIASSHKESIGRFIDLLSGWKLFVGTRVGAIYFLPQNDDADHALFYYRPKPYGSDREAMHDPDLIAAILSSREMAELYTYIDVEQINQTYDAAAFSEVLHRIGTWQIRPQSHTGMALAATASQFASVSGLPATALQHEASAAPASLHSVGIAAPNREFMIDPKGTNDARSIAVIGRYSGPRDVSFTLTDLHRFSTLERVLAWDNNGDDERCDDIAASVYPMAAASATVHTMHCDDGAGFTDRLVATVPVPLVYHHGLVTQQADEQIGLDSFIGMNDDVTTQPGAEWAYIEHSTRSATRVGARSSLVCRHCVLKVADDAMDIHNAFMKVNPTRLTLRFDPDVHRPTVGPGSRPNLLMLPASGFIYYLSRPEYGHDFVYLSHKTTGVRWEGMLSSDLVWFGFHHPLYALIRVEERGAQLDRAAFARLLRTVGTATVSSTE